MRADGSIARLDKGGPILGPIPDAAYSIGIESMEPGDSLILFTDGASEATEDGDEEYGIDRLIHVARANRHLDPPAMVDRIFTEVADFSQRTTPEDDQTVVVVKRMLPEPEEALA